MNKPCPFCGVTPTLGVLNRDDGFSPKDGGNVVHHGDEECPAEGFHILEVWNRRASPPPAEPGLREEVWKEASALAVKIINECREAGEVDPRSIRDSIKYAFIDAARTPPQKGETRE
jgi:hypothetical protein